MIGELQDLGLSNLEGLDCELFCAEIPGDFQVFDFI